MAILFIICDWRGILRRKEISDLVIVMCTVYDSI